MKFFYQFNEKELENNKLDIEIIDICSDHASNIPKLFQFVQTMLLIWQKHLIHLTTWCEKRENGYTNNFHLIYAICN